MTVPASYLIFEILGVVFLVICGYFRIKKADMSVIRVIMELFGIGITGLVAAIVAIVLGIIMFIKPQIVAYLIGAYLLFIGIMFLVQTYIL